METILNKEPVKRVKEIITKFDPNLKVIILQSTGRRAKDAASSLNCDVGAIVKSLLLKVQDSFLICLVAGDKRCSLNKLKKIFNKKYVRMANAEEVKENTGFSIGGVSPVGHIKRLDILIDVSLSRYKSIFAAAGHPNSIFKINYKELIRLTNGYEKEISEWEKPKL